MLGYEVTRRYGGAGLPDETIRIHFRGSAGQSFGAFVPRGISLHARGRLERLRRQRAVRRHSSSSTRPRRRASRPRRTSSSATSRSTARRAATRTSAGVAGERFAVRNSGAHAVVEGVGDHGCEYMTGGRVVVLGATGRNFAAGMSGGIAYVLDGDGQFATRANRGMVDLDTLTSADETFLQEIIERHVELTSSELGARVLDGWRTVRAQFVKVMPRDYKRVVEAEAHAAAEGRALRVRRDGGGRPWVSRPASWRSHVRSSRCVPVAERVRDWHEVYLPQPTEKLRAQGARCMDCGIPFCHEGCPLGNLIPDWNDLVYRDRWQSGDRAAARDQQLPRVHRAGCAPRRARAPACSASTTTRSRSRRSRTRSSSARSRKAGSCRDPPSRRRTGKRVAVVGSGPAGLAAADQLNRAGHQVTVFERADRIGGLLRYGIPEFKLEKRVLERRLALMRAEGVGFRTNAHIGVNVPARALLRDFDAVVLAGGAGQPRDLPIPGRELRGRALRDGVPDAAEPALRGRRHRGRWLHHRGRQARRHHRRRRYRRRLSRHGASPGRAVGAPVRAAAAASRDARARQPVAAYGRRSSACRPRTKKAASGVYSVATQRFVGDDDGRVAGAAGRQRRSP